VSTVSDPGPVDKHSPAFPDGPFDFVAGRYELSPDGRFKAEGMVHDGWCSMKVTTVATGDTLFYKEQACRSGSGPWFVQGLASHTGMTWAADSSSITFEGANGILFIAKTH
jgi:hypothetical protein